MVGLDVADGAVGYGVATGALDAAFTENLEDTAPSATLAAQMRTVDLITTTGGVGYVSERTFTALVDASDNTPWVAAFALRAYDYGPIERALAAHGLVTEQSGASFPQRRFADASEQRWAVEQVGANGNDPEGLETTGRYYADFFLSRPGNEVAQRPLADLVPACAGR